MEEFGFGKKLTPQPLLAQRNPMSEQLCAVAVHCWSFRNFILAKQERCPASISVHYFFSVIYSKSYICVCNSEVVPWYIPKVKFVFVIQKWFPHTKPRVTFRHFMFATSQALPGNITQCTSVYQWNGNRLVCKISVELPDIKFIWITFYVFLPFLLWCTSSVRHTKLIHFLFKIFLR